MQQSARFLQTIGRGKGRIGSCCSMCTNHRGCYLFQGEKQEAKAESQDNWAFMCGVILS